VSASNTPQALKHEHILNDLEARVELVPFPNLVQMEFFRSLLGISLVVPPVSQT